MFKILVEPAQNALLLLGRKPLFALLAKVCSVRYFSCLLSYFVKLDCFQLTILTFVDFRFGDIQEGCAGSTSNTRLTTHSFLLGPNSCGLSGQNLTPVQCAQRPRQASKQNPRFVPSACMFGRAAGRPKTSLKSISKIGFVVCKKCCSLQAALHSKNHS